MKIHVRHRRAKLRQHGYIKYRTQTIKIQRKLILNSTYGKWDCLRELRYIRPIEPQPYIHEFGKPSPMEFSTPGGINLDEHYVELAKARVRTWQIYTPELREQVANLGKTTVLSMGEVIAALNLLPAVGGAVTLEELENSRAIWDITQITKKDSNEPQ